MLWQFYGYNAKQNVFYAGKHKNDKFKIIHSGIELTRDF